MNPNIKLPANVFWRSELKRGGVRFDPNIIDTIVRKGLGYSFIFFLLLSLALWLCAIYDLLSFFPGSSFHILSSICFFYITFYLVRLIFCLIKRRKLRADQTPILCESFAVVLFDNDHFNKVTSFESSAVLYKEVGSLKPRFFTGAIVRGYRYEFCPEMNVRVFIDRKNPKYYSVDENTALSMISKRKWFSKRKQCVSAYKVKP